MPRKWNHERRSNAWARTRHVVSSIALLSPRLVTLSIPSPAQFHRAWSNLVILSTIVRLVSENAHEIPIASSRRLDYRDGRQDLMQACVSSLSRAQGADEVKLVYRVTPRQRLIVVEHALKQMRAFASRHGWRASRSFRPARSPPASALVSHRQPGRFMGRSRGGREKDAI